MESQTTITTPTDQDIETSHAEVRQNEEQPIAQPMESAVGAPVDHSDYEGITSPAADNTDGQESVPEPNPSTEPANTDFEDHRTSHQADSEDEDGGAPAVSVVIDEDDGPSASIVSEQNSTATESEEPLSNIPYQDHNYDVGRPAVRTNTSRAYFGDNNEPFPVIEGLASYIGDDHEDAQYNNVTQRQSSIEQSRIRTVSASEQMRPTMHSAANHRPVTSVISGRSMQQVRTIRSSDGYSPGRSVNIVNQSSALPPVFNPRRVLRPSGVVGDYGQAPPTLRVAGRSSEAGVPVRYAPISQGYMQRSGSNMGSPPNVAAIINDPSRAANDNAPAPFIIPSRGVKPGPRGRQIITPTRGALQSGPSPQGTSPRKAYSAGRAPTDASSDIHNYVAKPQHGDSFTPISASKKTNQGTPPDPSAINVVEEEEAQNAKFFQRQSQSGLSGAMGRQKQQQQRTSFSADTSQLPGEQQGEHSTAQIRSQSQYEPIQAVKSTAVKQTPPRPVEYMPLSAQQHSPAGAYRVGGTNLQQSQQYPGMPSILQRGGKQAGLNQGQEPAGYAGQRISAPHEQAYTSPDQLATMKQTPRPRGRPRGPRAPPDPAGAANISPSDVNRQGRLQGQSPNSMGSPPMSTTSSSQYGLAGGGPQQQHYSQQQQAGLAPQQYQVHQRQGYNSGGYDTSQPQSSQQQGFSSSASSTVPQRAVYPIPVTSMPMFMPKSPRHQTTARSYVPMEQPQQMPQMMPQEAQHQFGQQNSQLYTPMQVSDEHGQPPIGMYGGPSQQHLAYGNVIGSDSSVGVRNSSFDSFSEQSATGAQPLVKMKRSNRRSQQAPKVNEKPGKDDKNIIIAHVDDWEGEDYTTRCLCGMDHNDDFMIECDRCKVWQHGVCMGVTNKSVPSVYFCEECDPRPMKNTKQQAIAIQEKKRKQKMAIKEQLKFKNRRAAGRKPGVSKGKGKHSTGTKGALSGTPAAKRTSTSASSPKDYIQITENQYSRGVRALVLQTTNKGQPELQPLKQAAFTRSMFVAPNVKGLVATKAIPQGSPVIEYSGCFSLLSETGNKEKAMSQNKQNVTLIYSGFSTDGDTSNKIFVDASKVGSAARYARRSCKPNTDIRHVIHEGKLHLLLIATEDIDFSGEVTIPFDYDYRNSTTPVNCACSVMDDQFSETESCPVRQFNRSLVTGNKNSKRVSVISPASARQLSLSPARSPQVSKRAGLGRLSSGSSLDSSGKSGASSSLKFGNKQTKSAKKLSPKGSKKVGRKPGQTKSRTSESQSSSGMKSPAYKSNADEKAIVEPAKNVEKDTKDKVELGKAVSDVNSTPRRSGRTQSMSTTGFPYATAETPATGSVKSHARIASLQSESGARKRSASQSSNTSQNRSSTRLAAKVEPKIEEPSEIAGSSSRTPTKKTLNSANATPSSTAEAVKKTKVEETPPSAESKQTMSREERKMQQITASFERMEQREKYKKEKQESSATKKSSASVVSSRKSRDTENEVTAANRDNRTRESAVAPVTNNKLYGKQRTANVASDDSPVRKKPKADGTPIITRQLSNVEAAQLLTQMASGAMGDRTASGSIGNTRTTKQKVRIDIRAQFNELAQIVLSNGALDDFSLGPEYGTSSITLPSAKQKVAAKPVESKVSIDEYKRRRSQTEQNDNKKTTNDSQSTLTVKSEEGSKTPITKSNLPSSSPLRRAGLPSPPMSSGSKSTTTSFIPLSVLQKSNTSGETPSLLSPGVSVTQTSPLSIDDLKLRILGGSNVTKESVSAEPPIPSSSSTSAPVTTNNTQPKTEQTFVTVNSTEPKPKVVSTSYNPPTRMSLEERLRCKFGRPQSAASNNQGATTSQVPRRATGLRQSIGNANASQQIPPPSQLSSCPVPVSAIPPTPPSTPVETSILPPPPPPPPQSGNYRSSNSSARRW
ncbi:PHD-finger domain-containing protein [Ditylenchus destructor]|uniref:PHD-finger domain-containing protein n=1 Tax=Ditylenchus destructor TaxID=166010 RepID=A0AAD4NDP3_9BILA|nr:PHD-finger domain-containing protein [Ditylenchus destructor]